MSKTQFNEIIKAKIEELFGRKVSNIYLEITANKIFSNELKKGIQPNRDIIFHFLKRAAPDITGIIKRQYSKDFVVIEIKKGEIKLEHIYQVKKYRDLFNSKFTFLITLKPISEEIKRLHKNVVSRLLDEPISLHIKDGKVNKILGKVKAKELRVLLKNFNDNNMYQIAEIGIGLNHKGKIRGIIIEDESTLGTAHIGLGNNIFMGGLNQAKSHIDLVFKNPKIYLDSKRFDYEV